MDEELVALFHRFRGLSLYQKWEIYRYNIKEIYYVSKNYFPADMSTFQELTDMFRNEDGTYHIQEKDHIIFRYEMINMVGKGGFGIVVNCFDHKRYEYVAMKITAINDPSGIDPQNESNMLSFVHNNCDFAKDHVVNIYNNFVFRNYHFIVMELLNSDLRRYIKLRSSGIPEEKVRILTQALLESLNTLHKVHIAHGDFKPGNIAVVNETQFKLLDFGMSQFEDDLGNKLLQTRNYRAPEVFLRLRLKKAIDMWSVGCVVFELLKGSCLFSHDEIEASIHHICDVIGPPNPDLAKQWRRKSPIAYKYFSGKGLPINQRRRVKRTIAERLRKGANGVPSDDLVDFLKNCLEWNPNKRISCANALLHKWLNPTSKDAATPATTTNLSAPVKPLKPQRPKMVNSSTNTVDLVTKGTQTSPLLKPQRKQFKPNGNKNRIPRIFADKATQTIPFKPLQSQPVKVLQKNQVFQFHDEATDTTHIIVIQHPEK